jgi:hypothetical protein
MSKTSYTPQEPPLVHFHAKKLAYLHWQCSHYARPALLDYYVDLNLYFTSFNGVKEAGLFPELGPVLSPELAKGVFRNPVLPDLSLKQKKMTKFKPPASAVMLNLSQIDDKKYRSLETFDLIQQFSLDNPGKMCCALDHVMDYSAIKDGVKRDMLLLYVPFEDKGRKTDLFKDNLDEKFNFLAWAVKRDIVSKEYLENSGILLGLNARKLEKALENVTLEPALLMVV